MLGTRGQWGSSSHNTAPTASMTTPRRGHAFEKRNRPKCYEPLQRLCRAAPRSCRRSRAEAVERGPGQWRNTEQRPLERPACRALRRKPATNIRFWHFRTCGCRGNDVRSRRQNGPCLCLLLTSENGPKAVIGRSTVLRMPHFWLAARHPTTEVARADAKLRKTAATFKKTTDFIPKTKTCAVRCEQHCVVHRS
jgi:hypothetical protein